jgi:uncharacterized membrane protein
MRARDRLRTMSTQALQRRKGYLVLLWGLIGVAAGLRLACLTFQPLWWDEGWSLYFATTDVRTMLELTSVDIHPPLYYLLLSLWTGLFGTGVVAVRLLSVLIGVGAVPLLYVAGKRLAGERAGLLAAGLLVISPFHVYYSQEVRMYGLVMLLGLAAFCFALRWEPGNSGIGNWVGYVLATTAALHTQYYAAFLLLALNLVVLIRWRKRSLKQLSPWLTAQLAVALLFLPWVWYAGDKLFTYVRFKISVEQDPSFGLFTYLGRHLAAFDWGHAEGFLADWWWLGLLPLVILLPSLGVVFRQRRRGKATNGEAGRSGRCADLRVRGQSRIPLQPTP